MKTRGSTIDDYMNYMLKMLINGEEIGDIDTTIKNLELPKEDPRDRLINILNEYRD